MNETKCDNEKCEAKAEVLNYCWSCAVYIYG